MSCLEGQDVVKYLFRGAVKFVKAARLRKGRRHREEAGNLRGRSGGSDEHEVIHTQNNQEATLPRVASFLFIFAPIFNFRLSNCFVSPKRSCRCKPYTNR